MWVRGKMILGGGRWDLQEQNTHHHGSVCSLQTGQARGGARTPRKSSTEFFPASEPLVLCLCWPRSHSMWLPTYHHSPNQIYSLALPPLSRNLVESVNNTDFQITYLQEIVLSALSTVSRATWHGHLSHSKCLFSIVCPWVSEAPGCIILSPVAHYLTRKTQPSSLDSTQCHSVIPGNLEVDGSKRLCFYISWLLSHIQHMPLSFWNTCFSWPPWPAVYWVLFFLSCSSWVAFCPQLWMPEFSRFIPWPFPPPPSLPAWGHPTALSPTLSVTYCCNIAM